MVSTVKEAFETFYQNITPDSDLEREFVKIKDKIGNIIQDNFKLEYQSAMIVESGSLKRRTNISSFDMDLLLVFQRPDLMNKDLLSELSHMFNKIDIDAKPKVHAIQLKYNDYSVDIVPAIKKNDEIFYIEEKKGSNINWIETAPMKNIELVKNYNNKLNNKLIPTIRIFKYWNKLDPKCKFSSFHLESIILYIMVSHSNLALDRRSSRINKIFNYLPDYLEKTINEPAGIGPNLFVKKDKINCLAQRIQNAIESSNAAIEHETKGEINDALLKWREIFGSEFPVNQSSSRMSSRSNNTSSTRTSFSNRRSPEFRFG